MTWAQSQSQSQTFTITLIRLGIGHNHFFSIQMLTDPSKFVQTLSKITLTSLAEKCQQELQSRESMTDRSLFT